MKSFRGTVLENTSRTWERHFGMHFRLWFWGTDFGGHLGHSCGILEVVVGSVTEDGSEGHLKGHLRFPMARLMRVVRKDVWVILVGRCWEGGCSLRDRLGA